MLGGLLPSRASGILVSWRSSFWIGTSVILIFGWDASKPLMALVYTPCSGWLVALFHQVRVPLAADLAELELPPVLVLELPPLLHAAATVAVATASAAAA